MPHIRMRGLPEHIVAQLSQTLLEDLASVTQIKPDAFTLDWVPSISYRGGNIDISVVQVEVLWFPKAPEIQDEVERTIRNNYWLSTARLLILPFCLPHLNHAATIVMGPIFKGGYLAG